MSSPTTPENGSETEPERRSKRNRTQADPTNVDTESAPDLDPYVDPNTGAVDTKACSRCNRELPALPQFFTLDKRRPDGFRSECKDCRTGAVQHRSDEQFRNLIADLDLRQASELLRLSESEGSGKLIPHVVELYEQMVRAFGGPDMVANRMALEFLAAKPGSAQRHRYLHMIYQASEHVSKEGHARKRIDQMSTDEIKDAMEDLEKRMRSRIVIQNMRHGLPEGPPVEIDPEDLPPEILDSER